MRIRLAIPEEHVEPGVINATLEAVTRLDESLIRSGQSPTSHEALRGGAVWHPEPPGDEHFDHGATIAQRGWGDCDDWAPLHAATLRATGEDPGASAIVIPSGPNLWHALVKRSDGSTDDPSEWAGMPKPKRSHVSGVGEVMQVYACDPHDGRVYQGSLLPTTGPLSIHCGPSVEVRGHMIAGVPCFEGRCDMPIAGSPLLVVHGVRRHHVVGALPYALSCTNMAPDPGSALYGAITGAIMAGDAAEMVPNLDRYKLIATQLGMAGHDAAAVREAISEMIAHDVQTAEAQTGVPGHAHLDAVKAQLAAQHGIVIGYYAVEGFNIGDVAKIATAVVHTVAPVVRQAQKIIKPIASVVPWGDIVHGAEAAVSVIPGLGTAVSDVIAYGETAINAVDAVLSGSPLKFAIEAAYNFATASLPGVAAIRIVLDPFVGKLIDMAVSKAMPTSDELNKFLNGVPDKPKVGAVSPRTILASLIHIVVGHLGVKNTSGTPAKAPAVQSAPAQKAPASPPASSKPLGAPHAAVHVDAPKPMSNVPGGANRPVTHVTTTPAGAFHWHCEPMGNGKFSCTWLAPGSVIGGFAPVMGRRHPPHAGPRPGAPAPPTGGGMSRADLLAKLAAQRGQAPPQAPGAPSGAPASPPGAGPAGGAPAGSSPGAPGEVDSDGYTPDEGDTAQPEAYYDPSADMAQAE
jgi:hypothetical protein